MPEVRVVIRRVGVWSVSRLYGGIMVSIGLFFGLISAIASTIAVVAGASGVAGRGLGFAPAGPTAFFGVIGVVVLPVAYGAFGLIGGAVGAALYNLFADVFGGIEVEVES